MSALPSVIEARAGREAGIAQASDHADRAVEGWTELAANLIGVYARMQAGKPFLIEEARAYALDNGLTPPPDNRAWGGPTRMAERNGLIRRAGFREARSSHMSPKVQWVAVNEDLA